MATKKTSKTSTKKAARKSNAAPKAKKVSALDAAAKVLADTNEAMTCMELVETLAKRKLWTSASSR